MLSDIILQENVIPPAVRKPQIETPREIAPKKTFGLRDPNVVTRPLNPMNLTTSKSTSTEVSQKTQSSLDDSIEQYHPPSAADDYADIFRYTGRLDELLSGITDLIAHQAEFSSNPTNSNGVYSNDEDDTLEEDLCLPDELLASLYPRLF
ncbi:hypothetical protein CSKR_203577 [Clonorchis sinensis]|uniref:Uncharacterized protein n=1 Tax=Clonorchis sinensis TaxID=79923 RepID=A0A8T1MC65_CLOSI|nr:hypothetical protein CSKR_203577 [Clonorchis sinensis]